MQLSEIEDRLKIHDLFARYARSIDTLDEQELFACFTEDGVLETPVFGGKFPGRAGQREFLNNARKTAEGMRMRHLVTNLEVQLEGNRASAQAYLTVTATRGGTTTIFHCGCYDCRLKKTDGVWRFESRKFSPDNKK